MKDTKITNEVLVKTIIELEKASKGDKAKAYRDIARRLQKPRRIRARVNLYKLEEMICPKADYYLIPGKVLALGEINKKAKIVAFNFSDEAKKKIEKAGGKCLTFSEAIKENPSAKKVMILE